MKFHFLTEILNWALTRSTQTGKAVGWRHRDYSNQSAKQQHQNVDVSTVHITQPDFDSRLDANFPFCDYLE
jgi:hypothetical protein